MSPFGLPLKEGSSRPPSSNTLGKATSLLQVQTSQTQVWASTCPLQNACLLVNLQNFGQMCLLGQL